MEEERKNKFPNNGTDVDIEENDRGGQQAWNQIVEQPIWNQEVDQSIRNQEQSHEMIDTEGNEELSENNENNLKESWEQFTTYGDQLKEVDKEPTGFRYERHEESNSGNGGQIEDEVGINEVCANADSEQELNDEDQELYRRYQNLYRKYQKQYQEFQEEYGETEEQQEENGNMGDHGEYDEEQYRQYFEQCVYGEEQYNHKEEESVEEIEKEHYDEKYRENIQMGAIIQDALKSEDESLENTTETPRIRNKLKETAEYGQEGNLEEGDENECSDGETNLMITENGVTSVTSDGSIKVKIQPTDKEYETALLMGGEIMFDDVQIDEDDESENEEKTEKGEEQESELESKPVVFDTGINIEEIDKAILESLEKYSGGKVKDGTKKEKDLDVKSSKSKETRKTVQANEKGMLDGLTNLKALSFNAQNREILDSFRNKNYQSPAGPRKPKAPKRFACDICGTAFAKKNNLQKHQKTHSDEKPFACETCDARFTTKSNMQAHMRLHTGEKPYKCEICDAAFSQRGNLTKHLSIHTGEKPYKCYFCEAAFSDRGTMKTHIMLHTGERPYKCDQCKAEFTVESKLIKHQRMHTGERPFKCDICNAAFIHKTSLNKHMKRQIHNGDTPFKCQYCDLELTSQVRLNNHLRTHTEEKPFKCDSCHAEFSMKCSLAVHQRIHTGEKPFKCELCDATFSQRGSLTVHQRIHTGEKPFQCQICGASFFQKGSLCVHMRLHTNVTDENAKDNVFSAYTASGIPAEPGAEIGGGPGIGSEQDTLVPKKKKRAPRKKKADKVQEQKDTKSSKEIGNNDQGEVKNVEVSGMNSLEETKIKKKRKYTKKSSTEKKLVDVLGKGIADSNSGEKNEPNLNLLTCTKTVKDLGKQPVNMKLDSSVSPAMFARMREDADKMRKEQEKKQAEAAEKKEKKKLEEAAHSENQIKEKIRTKIEKERTVVSESHEEQGNTPKDYSQNQVLEKIEKQENRLCEKTQASHFDLNENQRNDQLKAQRFNSEEFHVNNHFENHHSDLRQHSISKFDEPQNLVTSKKIDILVSDKNQEETSYKRKYNTVENHDLSSDENSQRNLQDNVLNYSSKKVKLEDNMASPFPSVNVQQGGDDAKTRSIENVGYAAHGYPGKMPGFESSFDPRFPMVNNFGYHVTPKEEPITNSSKGLENNDYWRYYGGMGSMSRYDTKTNQGYLPNENPQMYSQQNWGFYPVQNMRFDTSPAQRFHPAFNFGLGAAGNWGIYPSNFPGFHTGPGQQSRSSESQQYHTSEHQRFQGTENELMGTATHNWNFYAGKTPMYDPNHGQRGDGNTKQNHSSGDTIAKSTDCTTTFQT